MLNLDGSEAGADDRAAAGMVAGKHYSAHASTIKALRKEGEQVKAAALLLQCVEAVEREAAHPIAGNVGVPQWFFSQLASIYAQAGRAAEASEIERRFEAVNARAAADGQRLLEEMREQIAGAAPGSKAPPALPTMRASPPGNALERLLGWIRGKR